jgi:hypothetical protein
VSGGDHEWVSAGEEDGRDHVIARALSSVRDLSSAGRTFFMPSGPSSHSSCKAHSITWTKPRYAPLGRASCRQRVSPAGIVSLCPLRAACLAPVAADTWNAGAKSVTEETPDAANAA